MPSIRCLGIAAFIVTMFIWRILQRGSAYGVEPGLPEHAGFAQAKKGLNSFRELLWGSGGKFEQNPPFRFCFRSVPEPSEADTADNDLRDASGLCVPTARCAEADRGGLDGCAASISQRGKFGPGWLSHGNIAVSANLSRAWSCVFQGTTPIDPVCHRPADSQ